VTILILIGSQLGIAKAALDYVVAKARTRGVTHTQFAKQADSTGFQLLVAEAAMKVDRGRPAAHAKLVDLIVVAATGVLVLVVVAFSAFAAFFSRLVDRITRQIGFGESMTGFLLRDGTQLLAIGVMVLLLYRFVPARKLRARGALAGAVLTALGTWAAVRILAVIFANFSRYNLIYGSLAGVMTFLFFVYIVALILLLGAEFAYAWSQPPGPPGPPIRTQLWGFIRGLFVYHDDDPAQVNEAQARRP
jgi:membrane protein